MTVPNFGQKSLDEVIEKLDERGLALRGMSPSSESESEGEGEGEADANAEQATPAAVS